MSGGFKRKVKSQRGEVMLEATFIFVPVLLLLFMLLGISFMFYQQAMITSVADEVASDVAKNLKYTELDIGEDVISPSDSENTAMYRTTFGKSSLESAHEERAKSYVKWRIGMATLGIDALDPEVECDIKSSEIGRAYVTVTVSQTSDFFMSGILDFIGITDEQTSFSATAYAECIDLTGYTSIVNFTQYAANKLSPANPIGEIYENIKFIINKLLGK